MIEIINLRNEKPSKEYDIKIDRTTGLGNPYNMKKNESLRSLVCSQYQRWFIYNVKNKKNESFNKDLINAIDLYKKHGKLRLFCFCAPKQCHGETIKRYIEQAVK